MISGRQALATIEQAIARVRSDEGRLDAALQSASEEAVRLRAERMDAFRELARIKLDALTREGVVGELDAAERRALDLLSNRRQALGRLSERRREAVAAQQQAEAERHRYAEALEQALAAVEELRDRMASQVRASPEWAAQLARIEEAERIAEQAEKKAAQAEADREEKRKPYEADPLFMYLWKRRFGTSEYRATPLVRFLDRKVAQLVGYDGARANYFMLIELPERLRAHAERLRQEAESERERLAAIEPTKLVEAGLESLEARVAEARAALEEAERRLDEANARLADLDREHDGTVGAADDVAYREAVELLAAADARQDLQALYREALRTPTPQDEAIVRRIQDTEDAIVRAEQEIAGIRAEIRELARRRLEIERERDEFRRRGYDRAEGAFASETSLADAVGDILSGITRSSVLRDLLRDGFDRRQGR